MRETSAYGTYGGEPPAFYVTEREERAAAADIDGWFDAVMAAGPSEEREVEASPESGDYRIEGWTR